MARWELPLPTAVWLSGELDWLKPAATAGLIKSVRGMVKASFASLLKRNDHK